MTTIQSPTPPSEPVATAPTYVDPEPMRAEPAPGTEREAGMDGILLAVCRWCDEVIWSGQSWTWEHVDTDEDLCVIEPTS